MAESGLVRSVITSSRDLLSGSFGTLRNLHKEIHNGTAFKAILYSTNSVNSTTLYIQINGYEGKEFHLKELRVSISEGLVDVNFYEVSSTITTGTTPIVAYNKDRTSTTAPLAGLFSDPVGVTSTAIRLEGFFVGSTSGTNTQPSPTGVLQQEDEWIIGNSTYVVALEVSTSAASVRVQGSLVWYEKDEYGG